VELRTVAEGDGSPGRARRSEETGAGRTLKGSAIGFSRTTAPTALTTASRFGGASETVFAQLRFFSSKLQCH
jgi:hypothetical protein